jgi:uncharacterized protein YlxW (UPF0749 family)
MTHSRQAKLNQAFTQLLVLLESERWEFFAAHTAVCTHFHLSADESQAIAQRYQDSLRASDTIQNTMDDPKEDSNTLQQQYETLQAQIRTLEHRQNTVGLMIACYLEEGDSVTFKQKLNEIAQQLGLI